MSVQIDVEGLNDLQGKLNELGRNVNNNTKEGILRFGYKIKLLAQTRIKDREHIVTSRLRNSIYVQAKDKEAANRLPENQEDYTWTSGVKRIGNRTLRWKSGKGKRIMGTVILSDDEIAIGTNVEYAPKIERLDSFLYWAAKNIGIDVEKYFLGVEKAKRVKNNTL